MPMLRNKAAVIKRLYIHNNALQIRTSASNSIKQLLTTASTCSHIHSPTLYVFIITYVICLKRYKSMHVIHAMCMKSQGLCDSSLKNYSRIEYWMIDTTEPCAYIPIIQRPWTYTL